MPKERLTKRAYETKVQGKNTRGRPRKTWYDWIRVKVDKEFGRCQRIEENGEKDNKVIQLYKAYTSRCKGK